MQKKIWKKSLITLLLPVSILSYNSYSHEGDDPLLTHVKIDQLELRDGNENSTALEAQLWVGKSLNKFWLKTSVERQSSNTKSSELQALYSRAITPFWDMQMGVRHDSQASSTSDWGAIGFQGLAPYWFDIDTALFVGESGHTAARFSAEYELRLTQRLILTPDIEINVYGQNDAEADMGSGVSDTTAGLRLRYEIAREFAPYLGFNWSKKWGKTADFAIRNGEATSDTELVIGLRVWF